MKAKLKNYRQSPRKVRLVADLVRGKSVDKALTTLSHTPKRASHQITKLIKSAVSNTKDKKGLFVDKVQVDEGVTIKRIRPRARGSAYLVRKRTSNVNLELGHREEKKAPKRTAKKSNKK